MTISVHVTFSANYDAGFDTLYTYLAYDPENIAVDDIVIVESPKGPKKARVVKVVNLVESVQTKLEAAYGPLKYAYSDMSKYHEQNPSDDNHEVVKVKRL
jgi:hypothetical protein